MKELSKGKAFGKAFGEGFKDGILFLVLMHRTGSLERRSRKRIESYDPSYLKESGDLERIGGDMQEAISNTINAR